MAISTIDTASISGLGYGFKNRIINGGMVIDQRNAGASVTPTDTAYSLDRWSFRLSQASKFTTQQNAGGVTPPTGFKYYLGVTSSSAYTVGASEFFTVVQYIEGYNVADLAWGTASAQTVTLSFWVRSSLTGTFGGSFNNTNNTRSYPFTFSISAANTWEFKTVLVPGDTSGTWDTTTGRGLGVRFNLGAGSTYSGTAGSWSGSTFFAPTGATSVVGTNGATFYITGVQLEKGTVATSFDWRPYGTELALCQRYYEALSANASGALVAGQFIALGVSETTTRVQPYYAFKVQKRTSPSTTLSTISSFGIRSTGSSVACSSGAFGAYSTAYAQGEFNNAGGGLVAGGCAWLTNHTGAATIEWSAEL